jgi:hypothetical protein
MVRTGKTDRPVRRVRKIDWLAALTLIDRSPPGTPFLIGRLHRSVATQINRGDYTYIDPTVYEAWTARNEGNVSEIWIRRRDESPRPTG